MWAIGELNPDLTGYESAALTVKLMALTSEEAFSYYLASAELTTRTMAMWTNAPMYILTNARIEWTLTTTTPRT